MDVQFDVKQFMCSPPTSRYARKNLIHFNLPTHCHLMSSSLGSSQQKCDYGMPTWVETHDRSNELTYCTTKHVNMAILIKSKFYEQTMTNNNTEAKSQGFNNPVFCDSPTHEEIA
jgi:hypothetical protein